MEIKQQQTDDRGEFYVEKDGKKLAVMMYKLPSSDRIIVEHTEVDESLRGQKVGAQLVQAAVDFARSHHLKIKPSCTYAAAVLKRMPEYADVLVQD